MKRYEIIYESKAFKELSIGDEFKALGYIWMKHTSNYAYPTCSSNREGCVFPYWAIVDMLVVKVHLE